MKPIPGYYGKYWVTRDGRVWSSAIQGFKSARPGSKYGHLKVTLWRKGEGKHEHAWVHRLVLLAWVGPPPAGHECRHLNSDPTDNRLENLEWATATANQSDRMDNKGQTNGNAKLTEAEARSIKSLRGAHTARVVAGLHNVAPTTVYSIWRGDTWAWL